MGALLTMNGVVKEFPGVRALDGVDLEVEAGEVHCLLGQNGAGKSTLIKVLSGAHEPDSGEIIWLGKQTTLGSPVAALRLGEGLSVAENMFLGHEPNTVGFSRRGHMRSEARKLMGRLGHPEIPPGREV